MYFERLTGKQEDCRVGKGKFKERPYLVWQSMKNRCYCMGSSDYALYGGRGIKVCDRWRNSHQAFRDDMGYPPTPDHSLDRIDSNGNYEPGNCRWATRREQALNRRSVRRFTYQGKTLSIKEWSEVVSIPYMTLRKRLTKWSPERAFTEKRYGRA